MRPFVFVVAPNPFEDAKALAYESDFWLKTRSGHLASFSNLVKLFNPVGGSQAPLANRMKAAPPLAGYYLESFLKLHGYDARAVFKLDAGGAWACGPSAPVAVAVSTAFITSVGELARVLLAVRSGVGPDVPIVVGGPFVWKQHLWGPDRFAGRVEFESRPDLANLFGRLGDPILRDAVYVANEFGEYTLLRLLELIRRGVHSPADLSGIENLVFWSPEGWRFTSHADEPVDLDRDFTRWDVVDDMPTAMVPIRASVGCPHKCEFCDFVAVHPRLRLRSPSSVVAEMRLVAMRGGTSVSFVDDNAFSSATRARALAREISESGLGMRWAGYLRADHVTQDDAELLARSGLIHVLCGIESGDPGMLRRMRKRSAPEAALAGIDAMTAQGVHVLATLVLGFPGETRASVDASVSFLNRLRNDARGRVEYMLWPFFLAPGSPVDRPDRRRELGLTGLFERWQHATMTSEEVHAKWAPYFFRGVDVSYGYYGGDNSAVWSPSRRQDTVMQRKALTLAFLDGASDGVLQERFATLHRSLCFTKRETPDWRHYLAARELQPRPAAAPWSGEPAVHGTGGG